MHLAIFWDPCKRFFPYILGKERHTGESADHLVDGMLMGCWFRNILIPVPRNLNDHTPDTLEREGKEEKLFTLERGDDMVYSQSLFSAFWNSF